jgi:hypothetical protein
MQAKLYLFAIKKNEEDAVFSHLTLGESVNQVISKFNEDLSFLVSSVQGDNVHDAQDVSKILSYFDSCSLWCLGSIDFVSGELIPQKEEHFKLNEKLEVLKNEC